MSDSEKCYVDKSLLWKIAEKAGLDMNQLPSITGKGWLPNAKKAYFCMKEGKAERKMGNKAEALKIYKECVGHLKNALEHEAEFDFVKDSYRNTIEIVQSWITELELDLNGTRYGRIRHMNYAKCCKGFMKLP